MLLTTLVFCTGFFVLFADEKAPVKAEKQDAEEKPTVIDYSKGFSKFYKFGLPDVKNTKYIKLNMYSGSMGISNHFRYQAKIDGDSWLISENKKTGKAKIIVNNGAIVEVYDHTKLIQAATKKQSGKKRKSWDFRNMTEGKLTGNWKKANLKKDADRIIKHLKEQQTKKHFWGQESLGNWFLFAIHLNQKGMKDKANELAGIVFELGKGKRKVILQALNALADAQYAAAYMAFKETNDWKQYSADIDKIIGRFRKGWKKTAGVKKLSEMLKKHLEGQTNKLPEGLTKEDAEILKELSSKKLENFSDNLWVISDISPKNTKKDKKEKPDVIKKITSRGIKSVPVLIALIGDDQLVWADKDSFANRFGGFGRTYHHNSSSNKNDADQIFRKLKRPMTRGEVARKILTSVVIQEVEIDNNGNEINRESEGDDSEEFKELTEKWYKANKGKTNLEFARLYLNEGNKAQKNNAVTYMLAKKIKSEYPVIEEFLLSGTRPKHGNDFRDKLAIKYAGRRGPEAEDFVKKYIEIMDPDGEIQAEAEVKKKEREKKKDKKKKSKDSNEMFIQNQGDVNNWQKKQILQVIEQLKGLTSKESVEDIIDDLLSGKKKWNNGIRRLLANRLKLSDKDIDYKLGIILKGALKSANNKKGSVANDFLRIAHSCANGTLMSLNMMFLGNFNTEEDKQETPPKAEKNKKVWLKLIASTTPFKEDMYGVPVSVGEIAAIYSEMIYNEGEKTDLLYPNNILGKANLKRLVERSKARFNGVKDEKLPKIPSIMDLSEGDLKKETDKLLAKVKKAKDIKKFASTLSLHDLLILRKVLDKDKTQNNRLIPFANKITNVTSSVKSGEKFAKFKGKPLSASMVNELRDFTIAALKNKKNIKCKLFRNALFKGMSIVIEEKKEDDKTDSNNKTEGEVLLAAEINVPGAFYNSAYWALAPQKAKKEEKKAEADNEEDDDFDELFSEMEEDLASDAKDIYAKKQKSFDEKVKMFEKGKLNSMLTGGIYFSGEVQ